jgi:hypothetical protein
MSSLGHLVFILALGRLLTLFSGCIKSVKVGTTVVVEAFRVLMDNVCGDFVEEGSVVGNDKNSAGVTLKIIGEESNRGDVQHVGRFVEKQKVRLAEQGTGKSQTHSPTTRKGLGGKLLTLGRETETC